jgi:nucleotide-binding universal stress UspA family protein
MKKILVPTDFSECSYYAVEYAARIARKTKAELYLLHIIEAPEPAPVMPVASEWMLGAQQNVSEVHLMMSLMEDAKSRMSSYRLRPELEGLDIVENIEVGSTGEIINTAASRYGIDLIVICAHGIGGENSFFIGSNAGKVIRNTTRPVITLKSVPAGLPENIVFASDFSAEAGKIFPAVRDFAALFGARIHLLKVNTLENFETTRESRHLAEDFLQRNGSGNCDFTVYNDLMIEPGILNFTRDTKADLIAIATHEKHGLGHLFNGSLTQDLISHADVPVLTVAIPRSSR